jgi:hypothetical protein
MFPSQRLCYSRDVDLGSETNSAEVRDGRLEFDFLCLIARPRPDLFRARQLLQSGLDHSRLLQLATVHAVQPQLIGSLRAMSWESVPAAARASLENYQQFHSARALSLGEELARLAASFSGKGLRFAAFKGPVLAVALYGDLSRREYTDLDILVSADRVDDAERLLESLGYHSAHGDRAFRRVFLGHLRQYAFVHPDEDTTIDLHWDFSGTHVPFPLAVADVWRDLEEVVMGSHSIPTVTGANLALLLAGHGTKESWRCLSWIADYARLLERQPDLDWLEIHRRARARGCGDTVLLGCALARQLLETPVPRSLEALIEGNSRVRALAALLARQLRAGELESLTEGNFTDLHLCDSRIDRLRAVARLFLTRTTGDYEAMKLPQALWPLYFVTRPFRLAAKALRSALR